MNVSFTFADSYMSQALVSLDLTVYTVGPPLHALIDSLELASENIVDERIRDILSKAQDASNSLINIVDNLLKLTDPEDEPNHHHTGETFNLKLTG